MYLSVYYYHREHVISILGLFYTNLPCGCTGCGILCNCFSQHGFLQPLTICKKKNTSWCTELKQQKHWNEPNVAVTCLQYPITVQIKRHIYNNLFNTYCNNCNNRGKYAFWNILWETPSPAISFSVKKQDTFLSQLF